jgi:hypothetical protein
MAFEHMMRERWFAFLYFAEKEGGMMAVVRV